MQFVLKIELVPHFVDLILLYYLIWFCQTYLLSLCLTGFQDFIQWHNSISVFLKKKIYLAENLSNFAKTPGKILVKTGGIGEYPPTSVLMRLL